MSTHVISKTERKKPLLIYNGFNYTIDSTKENKVYWKCEYCRTINCKGRIHTNLNYSTILMENKTHNHLNN